MTKNLQKLHIFLLIVSVLVGIFTFIFKYNSFSLGSNKMLEILVFHTFLLVDGRIWIRTNNDLSGWPKHFRIRNTAKGATKVSVPEGRMLGGEAVPKRRKSANLVEIDRHVNIAQPVLQPVQGLLLITLRGTVA